MSMKYLLEQLTHNLLSRTQWSIFLSSCLTLFLTFCGFPPKGMLECVRPGACERGVQRGASDPVGTYRARKDESTHARFFCDQAPYWWSSSQAATLAAIFVNLSMFAVLSIFWLLCSQAIHVLTRAPEVRGARSVFTCPDKNFPQRPRLNPTTI